MADLTDLQAAQTIKIAGANALGVEDNFADVDVQGGQIIAGEGTAGTPIGGVLSIQGVTNGTSIPIIDIRVPLTAAAPGTVSVGTVSAVVLASNSNRKGLVLTNTSNSASISFNVAGGIAILNSGITLYPRGIWTMDKYTFTTSAINGIASLMAGSLAIQEFS